jgi:hypothetical protein
MQYLDSTVTSVVYALDDDTDAQKAEQIWFRDQQDKFIHTVLDYLTAFGSDIEDSFGDRLTKFLALFPDIEAHIERALGPTFRRHKDLRRAYLVAIIWACLQRM